MFVLRMIRGDVGMSPREDKEGMKELGIPPKLLRESLGATINPSRAGPMKPSENVQGFRRWHSSSISEFQRCWTL
jgi:hypothetical protein